jgi:hypothetical protein
MQYIAISDFECPQSVVHRRDNVKVIIQKIWTIPFNQFDLNNICSTHYSNHWINTFFTCMCSTQVLSHAYQQISNEVLQNMSFGYNYIQ